MVTGLGSVALGDRAVVDRCLGECAGIAMISLKGCIALAADERTSGWDECCGRAEPSTARSVAHSHPPPPSMAARKSHCFPSSPTVKRSKVDTFSLVKMPLPAFWCSGWKTSSLLTGTYLTIEVKMPLSLESAHRDSETRGVTIPPSSKLATFLRAS